MSAVRIAYAFRCVCVTENTILQYIHVYQCVENESKRNDVCIKQLTNERRRLSYETPNFLSLSLSPPFSLYLSQSQRISTLVSQVRLHLNAADWHCTYKTAFPFIPDRLTSKEYCYETGIRIHVFCLNQEVLKTKLLLISSSNPRSRGLAKPQNVLWAYFYWNESIEFVFDEFWQRVWSVYIPPPKWHQDVLRNHLFNVCMMLCSGVLNVSKNCCFL